MAPTLIPSETTLRRSDFEFDLPSERIAQLPVSPRDHSRLMVVHPQTEFIEHRRFNELGQLLRTGDVLVINATRVFPARLRGRKSTGGKVEILLLRPEPDDRWQALVHGHFAIGAELVFPEALTARFEQRLENGEWLLRFSRPDVRAYLDRHGEMPLPPYIKRPEGNPADRDRYQTVFAQQEGSIAAPTAGFHFTPELLQALHAKGVQIIEIVLHVSWGTFRPVRVENVAEHTMLPEFYQVSEAAARALSAARQEKRRIVAVGTTAVRTLESIYDPSQNVYRSKSGQTNLFIYPGYTFQAIDALITNFHLPHSTPLFLACAFYTYKKTVAPHPLPPPRGGRVQGGGEPFSLKTAYQAAIQQGYRFYSYGDAMFIS